MTDVARPYRGPRLVVPVLAAIAIAGASALPAHAQPLAPAARAAEAAAVTRTGQWWLTALGVPRAWRAAPGKGKGVTVAVLSTGVDGSHRDLAGSVTMGQDFSRTGRHRGGPFWGGEGTAVASLIAGHGHGPGGADGITGIAPDARILSVQVTVEYNDSRLTGSPAIISRLPGAIAAGIRYAVARGAAVIALPLDPGTLATAGGGPATTDGSQAERAAVSYALGHDVLLIAPAGDDGAAAGTVNYPAGYPGVVAVGATERNGKLTPFSSTRPYVALTAPGAGDTAASAGAGPAQPDPADGLTVAAPGGGYGSLASTDMAAALTAGAAALIRGRYPWLTAAEVTQALERGTDGHPGQVSPGHGHGALDAAMALKAAAAIAAAHPRPATASSPAAQASPAAVPSAAARKGTSKSLVHSLLVDLVVAAGGLIAILAGAMLLTGSRRKRAIAPRSAQPHRPAHPGTHVRPRAPAALPAAPARPRASGRPHAPAGTTFTAATGAEAPGPRLAAAPRKSPVRARPGRRADHEKPPWGPARPPESPLPLVSAPAYPADSMSQPPWELSADFAPVLPGEDLPSLPVTSTGPMYVWNPASTGPQLILPEHGEEEP